MQVDFLIIGQGLAGSLLGWELIRRGQRILIVDNGIENASQVAAGLINPVTGMRFVKTAYIDELLPAAKAYYHKLEQYFGQRFLIEKPMLRLLRNDKERLAAEKRLSQTNYQAYLSALIENHPDLVCANGLLQQTQTAYLLTQPLLAALRQFFIDNNSYRQTSLDYQDLRLKPSPQWQDVNARYIIFCEGYRLQANPWFNWLPLQPVKGEIITAENKAPLIDHILNYGHWFIPLEANRFKTGATFDRDNLDTMITQSAADELLSALKEVYPAADQPSVLAQQAGIRPATRDRQPFIGFHPRQSALAVFNGFGAKGSLQIPYFCRIFCDALLNQISLPKHCDIKRYYDTHFLA